MAGDTKSTLAITIEWDFPSIRDVGPLQVTRYSVNDPTSITSLVDATQVAKISANEILTHVIERGNWPSLPPSITPVCDHGFPYTEIDCQYSPSHYTATGLRPNQVIAKYVKKMMDFSPAKLQEAYGGQLDVSYGPGVDEKMDIYGADTLSAEAPVLAYVHGGYWQEGSRKMSAVMVQNMVEHGVTTAVVGYDLAPTISLSTMVQEISNALNFLNSWCVERGSRGFYVFGHSAGAHLLASAICNSSNALHSLKGVFLVSGVYDLIPLMGTYIDRPLGLTKETAISLSPIYQIRQLSSDRKNLLLNLPVQVVVAQHESPALMEQSRRFFDSLTELAINELEFHIIDSADHFSMIEGLDDAGNAFFQLLRQWMNVNEGGS